MLDALADTLSCLFFRSFKLSFRENDLNTRQSLTFPLSREGLPKRRKVPNFKTASYYQEYFSIYLTIYVRTVTGLE